MKIFKLISQVLAFSIFLFIFSYGFLRLFFANIDWEFIYFLKNFTHERISPDIVVVEIDDLTYNKLGYPLDRKDYLPFLDNLKKAWASVIWFDILFLDKSKNPLNDINLASKFKELWNVVIWFDIKNWKEAVLPYDMFSSSVKNIGYFKPVVDEDTSKVYTIKPVFDLMLNWKRVLYESFSMTILREYYNYIYSKNDYNLKQNQNVWESYRFFEKTLPLVKKEFYILYSNYTSFKRESYYNIYSWNFNKDDFKDKIVLVWYTAQWVKDDFFVPWLKKGWTLKWVYVHANAINNILNDSYVIFFNKTFEIAIWFIFIFWIIYFNVFYIKNLSLRWVFLWAFTLFLVILTIYLIVFSLLFYNSWIFFVPNYPFEFFSILFLSFFVSSVLKYITEDKNKRLLSKALSEYVSGDIAKEILYSSWNVNLSWENKKITIFFSDIAWFTTISEKLTPEELVWFLRVYLWDMSDIIMDNKWFINKYEWDAIMALWWVFWQVENYWIIKACESCLLQQKKLKELNEVWESEWKAQLAVRMWLHSWNAIIWNIWSEWRKMEFTALWDSVNLASRLEWVNKFYWTYICCSEDIYLEAKEIFYFRYLDKIRVKWKNNWVKIYELLWKNEEISDLQKQIVWEFEKAMNFYLQKDFNNAKNIFLELSKLHDEPSKVYLDRCEKYLQNPPDENWDGIYTLNEK